MRVGSVPCVRLELAAEHSLHRFIGHGHQLSDTTSHSEAWSAFMLVLCVHLRKCVSDYIEFALLRIIMRLILDQNSGRQWIQI